MYLCRSLRWDGVVYPMAGLFPVDLSMHREAGWARLHVAAG